MGKIVLTVLVKSEFKIKIRISDSLYHNSYIFSEFFSLPYVVSAMYVQNHFHDNSIKAVTKMVKEIALEFRRILEESYWLDEKTRGKALQKLDSMSLHIGYPDWLMNDSEVEKLHKNSEINENSYVASLLSITKFATDYQFSKLRTPVEKNDWNMQMPPFTVNAAYQIHENGLRKNYFEELL